MGPKDHDGVAWSVGQHCWYPDYVGQQWLGGTVDSFNQGPGNTGWVLHITPDGGGAQVQTLASGTHHDPKPHNFPDAP